KDKAVAIAHIHSLFGADGQVTKREEEVAAELIGAIESQSTGVFAALKGALSLAISSQRDRVRIGREENLDDYLYNIVYYDLQMHLKEQGKELAIPESEARKLCLAAGIMAKVAFADEHVSPEEVAAVATCLES